MQTLLDINSILLEKIQELAEQGKSAPLTGHAAGQDPRPEGERPKASPEFVE
jgi:hypothetical protein